MKDMSKPGERSAATLSGTIELAYNLSALIDAARFAFDSDSTNVPITQRGIERTLFIASNMASELIDSCELMNHRPVQIETPKQ